MNLGAGPVHNGGDEPHPAESLPPAEEEEAAAKVGRIVSRLAESRCGVSSSKEGRSCLPQIKLAPSAMGLVWTKATWLLLVMVSLCNLRRVGMPPAKEVERESNWDSITSAAGAERKRGKCGFVGYGEDLLRKAYRDGKPISGGNSLWCRIIVLWDWVRAGVEYGMVQAVVRTVDGEEGWGGGRWENEIKKERDIVWMGVGMWWGPVIGSESEWEMGGSRVVKFWRSFVFCSDIFLSFPLPMSFFVWFTLYKPSPTSKNK